MSLLLCCSVAQAIQLIPMEVTLAPVGRAASTMFRVDNPGHAAAAVEVSVHRRLIAPDGTETLEAADDEFAVYPSQVVVLPGRSQAVRVQWLGDPAPPHELAYRLIAEQLPVDLPAATSARPAASAATSGPAAAPGPSSAQPSPSPSTSTSTSTSASTLSPSSASPPGTVTASVSAPGPTPAATPAAAPVSAAASTGHDEASRFSLRVLLKYVAALYVRPAGARPQLAPVVAELLTDTAVPQLRLRFDNHGDAHLLLDASQLVLRAAGHAPYTLPPALTRQLTGINLLARSQRHIDWPAPPDLPRNPALRWHVEGVTQPGIAGRP